MSCASFWSTMFGDDCIFCFVLPIKRLYSYPKFLSELLAVISSRYIARKKVVRSFYSVRPFFIFFLSFFEWRRIVDS